MSEYHLYLTQLYFDDMDLDNYPGNETITKEVKARNKEEAKRKIIKLLNNSEMKPYMIDVKNADESEWFFVDVNLNETEEVTLSWGDRQETSSNTQRVSKTEKTHDTRKQSHPEHRSYSEQHTAPPKPTNIKVNRMRRHNI